MHIRDVVIAAISYINLCQHDGYTGGVAGKRNELCPNY